MLVGRREGAPKTHLQNLLRERKHDIHTAAEGYGLPRICEDEAALARPDGKHRSKGKVPNVIPGTDKTLSCGR